jgi:hypothetical protein
VALSIAMVGLISIHGRYLSSHRDGQRCFGAFLRSSSTPITASRNLIPANSLRPVTGNSDSYKLRFLMTIIAQRGVDRSFEGRSDSDSTCPVRFGKE